MSVAWVGLGTTVAIGGVNAYNDRKARKGAENNARENKAIQQQELDFQVQRYNEWKDIYGDMQESLSDYYANISPSDILPDELANIQRLGQETQTRIETNLAQRGLDTSGISAQLTMQNELGMASAKYGAINSAEDRIAQKKQSFLAMGLGQEGHISNNMSNARRGQINVNNQGLNSVNQARANEYNGYGTTVGTLVGMASGAYNSYNSYKGSNNGTPNYIEAENGGAF